MYKCGYCGHKEEEIRFCPKCCIGVCDREQSPKAKIRRKKSLEREISRIRSSINTRLTIIEKQLDKMLKIEKEIFSLDIPESYENLLVEINTDILKRLRLEGKSYEAGNLLKAYHNNKEKQKIQDKKELLSVEGKKKRLLEKRDV